MLEIPQILYGFMPVVKPATQGNELVLAVVDGKLLLRDGHDQTSVVWRNPVPLQSYCRDKVLLGSLEGGNCYAWLLDQTVLDQPGATSIGLRGLLFACEEPLFALAARAVQLLDWQHNHRFCGSCGEPTSASEGDLSRRCPSCDLLFYPRISPCVITVVVRQDHCLLARAPQWEPGWFSALAGFVEAGESAREALEPKAMSKAFEEIGAGLNDAIRHAKCRKSAAIGNNQGTPRAVHYAPRPHRS